MPAFDECRSRLSQLCMSISNIITYVYVHVRKRPLQLFNAGPVHKARCFPKPMPHTIL